MIQPARTQRRGLTLAELLVASTITTMIVAALGVFTHAVMEGYKQTSSTGNATQSGRVVLSRINHAVATSRQMLVAPPGVSWPSSVRNSVLVWERDGDADDLAPGQPNWVEVVIYTRSKKSTSQLLELRPHVDSSLVAPLSDPTMMNYWVNRFREELDVTVPPVVLLNNTGGFQCEVVEYSDPQGIADLVQQDVRIRLCISPVEEQPTVFFGSSTRRYVPVPSMTTTSSPVPLPSPIPLPELAL